MLSVVICTRNRPDTVGQAIESVAECDFSDYDIHIMDQSTDAQTQEIVAGLARRFEHKLAIHYHHLDKAGLSRAYNAGLRATSGEIIACTDDDVVVAKDWLAQIERAFARDVQAGLLYGQVLIPQSLQEAEQQGIIVPSLPIPKAKRFIRGKGFKVFGMGANMAMRRSFAERVGGFDEALGGGGPLRSSQDFDFAYRMYLAGAAVLLEPSVKVDHYGTRTREQWPATMKAYGIGDGAFYAKHIRCGDVFAAWLFAKVLAKSGRRHLKHLLLERRVREDDYTPNLWNGIREASKFAIDRKSRLYRETDKGKLTVTEANAVTGVQRTDQAS
jgi:glycosyltransferase involved in cell wall biosynthesis